jgi:hypothetical protein
MGPDMIIVLGLALAFFGGIGYLAWKENSRQKPKAVKITVSLQDNRPPIEELGKRKLQNN